MAGPWEEYQTKAPAPAGPIVIRSREDVGSQFDRAIAQMDRASTQTQAASGPWTEYQKPQEAHATDEERRTVMGFLANIPKSTGQLIGGMLNVPRQTEGITSLFAGMAEKSGFKPLPGNRQFDENAPAPDINAVDALVAHYKDRYGSIEGFKKALYEDPAGVALDVATVLEPAGAGLKAANLPRAAAAVTRTARAVNPLVQTTRLGGAVIGRGLPAVDAAMEAAAQRLRESSLRGGYNVNTPHAEVAGAARAMRGMPLTTDALEQVTQEIRDLQQRKMQTLGEAELRGAAVPRSQIVEGLQDLRRQYQEQPLPGRDVRQIDRTIEEVLQTYPEQVPAARAEAIKEGLTWKEGLPPELQATAGAERKIAEVIRQNLVEWAPELEELNKSQQGRIWLQDFMGGAINKRLNSTGLLNRVFNLKTIGAGLAGSFAGPQGILGGAVVAGVLADPVIQSHLAAAINKAQQLNPARWGRPNMGTAMARAGKVAEDARIPPERRFFVRSLPAEYPEVIPPGAAREAPPATRPVPTPAEAIADFEQQREARLAERAPAAPLKPTPIAQAKADFAAGKATADLEGQLAESLAAVESGRRPVAQVAVEKPRAATVSDKRVEAYAQHFAADPGTAIADIEPLTKLPEFPKLGRALEIEGALAPGEAERIAARVKELRGEAAAAPAAIIEPDVKSTPTIGQTTGEQSGSPRTPVHGPREPGAPVARGMETSVRVPGEKTTYQGQFAVRELGDVHASHNAQTFDKNPNYQFRNDRDYSNPVNKERVVVNSKGDTFDPAYVLADSPDATNGAPVIDSNGNVLGGNSRAMILDRVYKNNPAGAAAYRAELARRAQSLGIDPERIAGMKRPVLVRELSEAELNPQRAITDLNKTGTASLTAAERATADARMITPAAADYLASALDAEGAEATLSEVLSGKAGIGIVNRLVDDGVFTMQERPNLIDPKTGAVTAAAKDRISKLLLGQVFEDADQMMRTPAEVRNKLERTVSPILQSSQKRGFDIRPTVREALDVLEYARAHGITQMSDLLAQESMFGDAPKFSPQAADLAQFLRDTKPTTIAQAFRRYVANAEPTMFGESTPAEAFADAFGTQVPPSTLRELMQPEPPAAVAPRRRRAKPVR